MQIDEFKGLMRTLAAAWGRQDTAAALACFAEDAVYMEPPDVQLFVGHEQLSAYFDALGTGTFLRYENLWFDEDSQTGAAEFAFGLEGQDVVDRGIIVVVVQDGVISHWREYHRKGPANFNEFVATEDKSWQWHIGNYP